MFVIVLRDQMSKAVTSGTNSRPKESHGTRRSAAKAATLAEVARLAGVVPMTASRAINGSGYVSDAVRQRVLQVARELNYRPNILARKLRGQELRAVGILLPDIANPFSAQLVAGMKEILELNGYTAFIATANRNVAEEQSGLVAFLDHGVDGILVATIGTQLGDDALGEVVEQGVPIVTVGRPVQQAKIDCVTADHYKGTYEVVTHLIHLGHKRIGFIGVALKDSNQLRRFHGYAAALKDAGIALREDYVVGPEGGPAFSTQEDGYDGIVRLSRVKRPPTAVFARNDYTAIGALGAAHEMGLKVPDDIAIAGFDNIPLSNFTIPPLTTVEQPIAEQGRHAAYFLLDRIEKRVRSERREVCLPCRLIVRQSTDPSVASR
jgi:DNA-binding LacI/PurR family transcriptional regulator